MLWIAPLSLLFSFGGVIWTIFSGPSKANAVKIELLTTKVAAQDLKISALEQATKHLPTQSDMHGISMALEGVKGEMKAMRAEMEGSKQILVRLESTVARHDNHLLKS
jgi:peptidoglycan hydrolase CwlO-like protein